MFENINQNPFMMPSQDGLIDINDNKLVIKYEIPN